MAEFQLIPHPDFPSAAITSIDVEVDRREPDLLEVAFWMHGDTGGVIWPDLKDARFADQLWKHTCCEAFARSARLASYVEINVAQSMEWAAYSFDDFRSGVTALRSLDPISAAAVQPDRAMLSIALRLPLPAADAWRLNLTTIIEAKDGSKSFWALAHAPGPPDFHNPDCFIATLPAPAAS